MEIRYTYMSEIDPDLEQRDQLKVEREKIRNFAPISIKNFDGNCLGILSDTTREQISVNESSCVRVHGTILLRI
jgi:hypothetical protein